MRTAHILFLLIFIVVVSCQEDADPIISYPDTDIAGENVLGKNDFNIIPFEEYSFSAVIPSNKSVKIVMKNTSSALPTSTGIATNSWRWVIDQNTGWINQPYDWNTHTQTIIATGQVKAYSTIDFSCTGSAIIEIYENNQSSAPRTKTITW